MERTLEGKDLSVNGVAVVGSGDTQTLADMLDQSQKNDLWIPPMIQAEGWFVHGNVS